jgi:DNA-3-methyladenine glycosylase
VRPLPTAFFRRPAETVARELLGARIVSQLGRVRLSGIIGETEAYLGHDDPASHAYQGRKHKGNLNLYGPPGTWYVYRSYGIHWCANLVCGMPAPGGAVLLRAIFPLEGVEVMRRRRGGMADRLLANGPGKLCQALGITRSLDGSAMRSSDVVVGEKNAAAGEILVTPRIGITKAVDWPLRFVLLPSQAGSASSLPLATSSRSAAKRFACSSRL